MQVLLQEKIAKLGDIGDQVKVAPGYARNYLLPQNKALRVTPENLAYFEEIRAELEKKHAEVVKAAEARAKQIAKVNLALEVNCTPEGKLYGSITVAEIIKLFEEAKVEVNKSEVTLTAGPIRHVGEFEVVISLPGDVQEVKAIKVDAAEGQLDEAAQAAAEEMLAVQEEAEQGPSTYVEPEAEAEGEAAKESAAGDAGAPEETSAEEVDAKVDDADLKDAE